ncbi:DUF1214 domain-containing protein [Acidithiobacillus sp.]|uniref:DUF1254 domain-containing protein n=1 Tax=Acidithiobacillus sp. TaxID=1872118 RepID=UPI0031FE913E
MLTRPWLDLAVLTLITMTNPAIAQDPQGAIPSLIKPADAASRMDAEQARETEAYTLGVQTVIWGMQWVKAGQTLRVAAKSMPPGTEHNPVDACPHAIDVWGHARALLTHEVRVIETPNTETLYSNAVVDLQDGPVVLVHPDFGERYFRTSVWELHGDAHTISQKKDGPKPPPYALLPDGWKGTLPEGLRSIRTRSRYVLISPHIAVYGNDDLANVYALQNGFRLIALKDWGKSNKELAPRQAMRPLRRPGTKTPAELLFFEELCETLKDITIRDDELGFARQAERIGVTRTDGFQFEKLGAAAVAGLKRAVLDGQSIIEHKARTQSPVQPGGTWMVSYDMTSLDDWLLRASVGWKYVWGDLPGEILFPIARNDEDGRPLSGERRYRLHFPAGQLPPSRYWRISMFDLDGYFTGNPIRRYGIGNMAEKLQPNADGSLTLYIQHDSPGKDKEVNWLPAPKETFFLMMRMYQPEERMYSGAYVLPPVQEVK